MSADLLRLVQDLERRAQRLEAQEQRAAGLSGVLVLDDGTNWRVTLTFMGGLLTTQVIAASSGAAASWT